jgi:hypothetical protein
MADAVKNGRETYAIDYIPGDYESAVFMGNPHIDALFTSLQIVGSELWTSRRRQYIVEAMMERKIPVTNASIEQYVPSAEEEARWKQDRDRMVGLLYAPFLRGGNIGFASAQARTFNSYTETNGPKVPPIGEKKL